MAQRTYVGNRNLDTWTTTSNWSGGSVPVSGQDTWVMTGGSVSDQWWGTFPNYTLPAAPAGQNSLFAENSSASAGSVFSIGEGGAWPPTTRATTLTLAADVSLHINYTGADPYATNNRGAYWNVFTDGTSAGYTVARKFGNGFLSLRGPSSAGAWNRAWEVWGGSLVPRANGALGQLSTNPYNNVLLMGTGATFSPPPGSGTYSITIPHLVISGNYSRLGSYYDTANAFTGTFQPCQYGVVIWPAGQDPKPINITGSSVVFPGLYEDNGYCGFEKYGTGTLTINGNAWENGTDLRGAVRCTNGSLVLGGYSTLKYATFDAGNERISTPPNTSFQVGGISGSATFYFDVNRYIDTGFANNNDTMTGSLVDRGGSAWGVWKYGTGTWTLSGNNTFTSPIGVFGGTLKAASSTALGSVNGNWVYPVSGRLELAANITKNSGLYVEDRNNIGTGSGVYVASGSYTYSPAFVTLRGVGTFEAAAGATMTISSAGAFHEEVPTYAAGGVRKLGAGTVVLHAPGGFLFNSSILATNGTLRFTGSSLTNKAITLSGGTVDATFGAGTSLTVSGTSEITSSVAGAMTSAVSVPAGASLKLSTSATSNGRPVNIVGSSNITVSGTLRTGSGTQKGSMSYGGNVTFAAGSTLVIG